MNNKNNKGFAVVLVIVLIAIIVIGAGVYYYSMNKSPKVSENTPTQNNKATVTPEQTVNNTTPTKAPISQTNITPKTETNSLWKTYQNNQRKFSFNYPSNGKISEIKGNITLTVLIDRPATYSLYFFQQGRADDFSTYKVLSEKKIPIAGLQAIERIMSTSGNGDITVSIEIKRYTGSDGLERSDSFVANFQNISEANKALPEIEAIAKTLEYF
jgi:flagellar basal body-associated protein FliL